MTEKPIRFNAAMVRAILEGRKTQTRRVVQFRKHGNGEHALRDKHPLGAIFGCDCSVCRGNNTHSTLIQCPYGVPGDRLWVRETWGDKDADHPRCKGGRKPEPGDSIVYRADPASDYQWGSGLPSQSSFCWRPSIFMPRWASRILLEITNIRVKRVQEISEADAKAEGAEPEIVLPGDATSYVAGFYWLWDRINFKRGYGWEKNPWCWVIEFRRQG